MSLSHSIQKKTKGTGKPLTDYEKASRGTVTLNFQYIRKTVRRTSKNYL